MIGYVTLGTNNLEKSRAFFDALLGTIGARRVMDMDRFTLWGASPNQAALGVISPFDGNPATPGNGNMVALAMDQNAKVDALHQKALELGAMDEGAPGPRGDGGFYGAYFRDLDGNKLCVFCLSGR